MPAVHIVTPDGERAVYDEEEARERNVAGDFPVGTRFWIPGITEWRPVEELIATLDGYPPCSNNAETLPPEPEGIPLSGIEQNIIRSPATSRLAIAALVLGLVAFFLPIISGRDLFGLLIAIPAIVCGHAALRVIKKSGGWVKGSGRAGAGLTLGYLVAISILFFPEPKVRGPRIRSVDASNIRQIGQASLIYANDHGGTLPPVIVVEHGIERVATIHDAALLLAFGGGLNDSDSWFSRYDKALSGKEHEIETVLASPLDRPTEDPWERGLKPDFAAQQVFSFDYVTGLTVDMPSTTPIAWTRGLRLDGTWDEEGVYGTDGGHIVFLGGNVMFYKNLGSGVSGGLMGVNGERTSNI